MTIVDGLCWALGAALYVACIVALVLRWTRRRW
jgi:hypothetical protein